jgi:hypothetical protein
MLSKSKLSLYESHRSLPPRLLKSIEIITDTDYLMYEDHFGRKWKLEPIVNENILSPFKITPSSINRTIDK